ncbi:MAG: hypothetical protein PHV18_15100 [Lachnospiraceae bacterium]|nr:hypothetical protein [Lachnospiraceae bacterium]
MTVKQFAILSPERQQEYLNTLDYLRDHAWYLSCAENVKEYSHLSDSEYRKDSKAIRALAYQHSTEAFLDKLWNKLYDINLDTMNIVIID